VNQCVTLLSWGADNLSAQTFQDIHLLLAHFFGQRDDHAIALERGGQGQTNARVATRGLNQGVAGLDSAASLCIQHHALANAVLDTAARVKKLALDKDFTLNTG